MATDFLKKLKAQQKAWKSAKEKAKEKTSSVEFDDGKYMARLVGAELGESESSGRFQCRFEFRFEDGPYEGQSKYDYQGLENEQNLVFFTRRIEQLGYESPDDLTEVPDILEDIKKNKPLCKIQLKTKGDFQNVYINKVFVETTDETDTEEEVADADEPVEETETEAAAADDAEEEGAGGDEEEEAAEEADEEDEEVEEEETVELNVGMTVIAATSSGPQRGEVIEILDTEGKARIRLTDGKVIRIALEKIEVDQTVPEEPKVAPKKKAAPAPAPAPKKGKK